MVGIVIEDINNQVMDTYEQAYKDTLAKARLIHHGCEVKETVEVCEIIFPELKRERMITSLIDGLSEIVAYQGWKTFGDTSIDELKDWLQEELDK